MRANSAQERACDSQPSRILILKGCHNPFRLVYLVFNALFGLLSQARQAECFLNVARVLDPGGVFVLECFVPDPARFDRDQRVQTIAVNEDSAIVQLSLHNAAEQRVTAQIVTLGGQGMQLRPVALRYSWPRGHRILAASIRPTTVLTV